MMQNNKQSGYAIIETALILFVLCILGITGWFIWNAKQNADRSLDAAATTEQGIVANSKVTDFVSCKAAKGSKMLETYPEQCMTKDGKTFTDGVSTKAKSDGVQQAKFSALPSDLKSAIAKHATCANGDGQLLDETGNVFDYPGNYFVANKAAFVGECQTIALYVDVSGQWQFIYQTQFGFSCSVLKKYAVPKALVAVSGPDGTCLDANDKFIPYQ
jgi:hypothetical protein